MTKKFYLMSGIFLLSTVFTVTTTSANEYLYSQQPNIPSQPTTEPPINQQPDIPSQPTTEPPINQDSVSGAVIIEDIDVEKDDNTISLILKKQGGGQIDITQENIIDEQVDRGQIKISVQNAQLPPDKPIITKPGNQLPSESGIKTIVVQNDRVNLGTILITLTVDESMINEYSKGRVFDIQPDNLDFTNEPDSSTLKLSLVTPPSKEVIELTNSLMNGYWQSNDAGIQPLGFDFKPGGVVSVYYYSPSGTFIEDSQYQVVDFNSEQNYGHIDFVFENRPPIKTTFKIEEQTLSIRLNDLPDDGSRPEGLSETGAGERKFSFSQTPPSPTSPLSPTSP